MFVSMRHIREVHPFVDTKEVKRPFGRLRLTAICYEGAFASQTSTLRSAPASKLALHSLRLKLPLRASPFYLRRDVRFADICASLERQASLPFLVPLEVCYADICASLERQASLPFLVPLEVCYADICASLERQASLPFLVPLEVPSLH